MPAHTPGPWHLDSEPALIGYAVVSHGRLGLARPERSFENRTQALRYRDELNARWVKEGREAVASVIHHDVEGYVEWNEDDDLTCPDCGTVTSDGEYCGECLSERASYYTPEEG